MSAIKKVIIALDQMSLEEIEQFLTQYQSSLFNLKIGLELFTKYGPSLLNKWHKKYNIPIFLDLKLHDIPKTVERSIASLAGIPLRFLTIHLSGGQNMIETAIMAQKKYLPQTALLGVSVLTSLDQNDLTEMYGQGVDINSQMNRFFFLAKKSGLRGLVLSAQDLQLLKKFEKKYHYQFTKVTPGIRFSDDHVGDQKRVMTPSLALENGADFLVIGRSLTKTTALQKRFEELKKI